MTLFWILLGAIYVIGVSIMAQALAIIRMERGDRDTSDFWANVIMPLFWPLAPLVWPIGNWIMNRKNRRGR